MSRLSEHSSLSDCLTWSNDNDFGILVPEELLRDLSQDYAKGIAHFLSVLEGATLDERCSFYKQIYEVLYVMAAKDDAESINKVFELCPDLAPEGYYSYDQVLPLGEAIEHTAYNAINALVKNGCDINTATFGAASTIGFAAQYDDVEQMIPFLIEKGVSVEFQDIIDLWIWNNASELARRIINRISLEEIHRFIANAEVYAEDMSIYCYGGLDDQQKTVFGELLTYLKAFRK